MRKSGFRRPTARWAWPACWRRYAARRAGLYRAVAALGWRTQAAFGRRFYPGPAHEARVRRLFGPMCRRIHRVTVSRVKVERLEEQLDRRFAENTGTLAVSQPDGLEFVKDPEPCSIVHNSNRQVVIRLRAMDCQVSGLALFGHWRIRSTPGQLSPAPPQDFTIPG